MTGAYHAARQSRVGCLAAGAEIIPYGCSRSLPDGAAARAPPPTAIFTSNPLRGLDWLARSLGRAHPACGADGGAAHLCRRCGLRPRRHAASAADGRGFGSCRGARRCRGPPLPARRTRGAGEARCSALGSMLYRGDPGETFCLALAEAQAMGVPAVVETPGLDARAGHRRGDRARGRRRWRFRRGRGQRCCATTGYGGAGISPLSPSQRGMSCGMPSAALSSEALALDVLNQKFVS